MGWGDDVTSTLPGSDKYLPQPIIVGLLDSNSNGMDDRWELEYFGNFDELAENEAALKLGDYSRVQPPRR